MTRTDALRSCIRTRLKEIDALREVYYEVADPIKLYPHAVFSFESVGTGDFNREDYLISVDVWDKSTSASVVETICDEIIDKFQNHNAPQSDILPTFFVESRRNVPDEDLTIRHRLIRLQAQNYERKVNHEV